MVTRKIPRIYQIKVTLKGVKPPVWRRLQVSSNTDRGELHDILQVAMGWTDEHLHMFVMGDKQYGVSDPDFEDETIPEEEVRIGALLKKAKASLIYEYDFGDRWVHEVVLEKILEGTEDEIMPKCIAGRRSCPPEDVGGVWRYMELLKAFTNTSHPEHEESLEWFEEDFDPEHFDPLEVNEILAEP